MDIWIAKSLKKAVVQMCIFFKKGQATDGNVFFQNYILCISYIIDHSLLKLNRIGTNESFLGKRLQWSSGGPELASQRTHWAVSNTSSLLCNNPTLAHAYMRTQLKIKLLKHNNKKIEYSKLKNGQMA